MVRIGHLSTYTMGGAAVAARRLHDGLVQLGADSRFWHGADPVNLVDDPRFAPAPLKTQEPHGLLRPLTRQWERIRRRPARHDWRDHLQHRPEGFEVFSPAMLFQSAQLDWSSLQCDLLHLHWVAFLVDYPSFFAAIPQQVPLVWTLHDQAPFTGGCHYSTGCERFASGCGQCPQIANPKTDDVSHRSYELKRKALRNRRLTVVTPSHWLGSLAQRSGVWPRDTRFVVIPYGLDLELYRPRDRGKVRRELGIGEADFTLVFGAEDIANRRKGMPHLARALQTLESRFSHRDDAPSSQASRSNPHWHAIVFGDGQLPELPSGLQVHRVGYVRDEVRKAECLSAGDVFVLPSLEDNQPQTGLEALACGTPVIAYAAGGIPEYVRENESGWLAPVGNVQALAHCLEQAAQNAEHRRRLSLQGRELMEREFPLMLQAERMLELYRESLAESQLRKVA